jgi:hypothetical protein
MSKLEDEESFLIDELKSDRMQSSWDWESDLRFAERFDMDCELLREAIDSSAPLKFRYMSANFNKTIKQRRLSALRRLVKKGVVRAWWSGTGVGGASEFGVGRVRSYSLV